MEKDEMKKKLYELIELETNELKLIRLLHILQEPKPREISAEEIFAEVSDKYGEMMKKLANPDYIMQKRNIDGKII